MSTAADEFGNVRYCVVPSYDVLPPTPNTVCVKPPAIVIPPEYVIDIVYLCFFVCYLTKKALVCL